MKNGARGPVFIDYLAERVGYSANSMKTLDYNEILEFLDGYEVNI